MRRMYEVEERYYYSITKQLQQKIKQYFDLSTDDVTFYTHQTVPDELKKRVISIYSTHPPAYVDPQTLSVVIDIDFYNKLSVMKYMISHELGHLLSIVYEDKLKDANLNYTRKYDKDGYTIILPDVMGKEEKLADMFAKILTGQRLDNKEQQIINALKINY